MGRIFTNRERLYLTKLATRKRWIYVKTRRRFKTRSYSWGGLHLIVTSYRRRSGV